MQITIPTPRDFNFRRTVMSHGWCVLPPFEFDKSSWTLTRVLEGEAAPVTVRISSMNGGLAVKTRRRPGVKALKKIVSDVRHIFRLDDDLQAFYGAVSEEPDFAWIASEGAGRMLRSPTVFEDLVKMICTTNCSWALTEKMVNGLVNELGREADDGRKSFPSAEAMAQEPVRVFRDRVRAGYRAPYLKELAHRVASGALDVESWLANDLPTQDLIREIKSVKGAGNYAAENLLRLIGRYDGLALDSWTRAQFARVRNKGRGLVLWCDVTRHWLDPENVAKW